MKFLVFRRSELGRKEHNYWEQLWLFATEEEAKSAKEAWEQFLAGYPCNGDAYIVPVYKEDELDAVQDSMQPEDWAFFWRTWNKVKTAFEEGTKSEVSLLLLPAPK